MFLNAHLTGTVINRRRQHSVRRAPRNGPHIPRARLHIELWAEIRAGMGACDQDIGQIHANLLQHIGYAIALGHREQPSRAGFAVKNAHAPPDALQTGCVLRPC